MESYMMEMTQDQQDEDVLIQSVTHPGFFALLVRKYEASFLRKAMSIVHDQEEAEDIVQETFTKIYLNAARFKKQEGAQFSSWGYRILINVAYSHYQKLKRRNQTTVQFDDDVWAMIPDKNLRQFQKTEITDEIASILSRMSPMFARALELFYIEGRSQEEMASLEGVSLGAMKTRVHRAKHEFRKIYKTVTNSI